MKISNKTIILYICRLILIAFISKPLLSLLEKYFNTLLLFFLWLFLLTLSGVYLYLRGKSYELKLLDREIIFSKGVFFRKTICVKYEKLTAISRYYTPLERYLSLVNIFLCTEGKAFLLFPVSEEILRKLCERSRLPL